MSFIIALVAGLGVVLYVCLTLVILVVAGLLVICVIAARRLCLGQRLRRKCASLVEALASALPGRR